MQRIIKALALALAIVIFSGCALVSKNPDRIVVAQVKDYQITLTEYLDYALPLIGSTGVDLNDSSQKKQIDSYTDTILSMMVRNKMQEFKLEEYGVAEEPGDRAIVEKQVAEGQENFYKQYSEAYAQANPEATEDEVKAATDEYMAMQFDETYTYEDYVDDSLEQYIEKKLVDRETADVEVTDEQVRAQFDAKMQQAKDDAAEDLGNVEIAMKGATTYYIPEGLFYVKHILIAIPREISEEISAMRSEDKQAEADALLRAELDRVKPKAEEALAKVNAGEDFDAVIEEYGEDPGMQAEPDKSTGYLMYKDNANWDVDFTAGSMTLTEDGATTGLVESLYGYHIIKRVSTVEPYELPFEEVKESIYEEMYTQAQDTAFQVRLTQWAEEMGVQVWSDRVTYQ